MTNFEPNIHLQNDYIATLKRAFTGPDAADYVTVDGFMGFYMRECTNWLMMKGYIVFDERKSKENSDEQYTAMCYRLTPAGNEVIK